uniref:Alpha-51D-immobilization antigen n=1 Tax=Paramecium tetraurelia TaxID=5888 RepID=Q27183_PARTE|nr:alpha-51D-immobilization antigen [Paramecium tetraurelia]
MKNLIFICLLAMVLAQQVQHTNKCNDCGQLKSQNDCEQEVTVTGACEWVAASGTTAAKCQKKTTVDPVASFKPYCELVDKPETNCAKTLGCAYVDSKCTHFTGCQAYVKTTTTDCQAISYFCVSDGNSCIEAKECKAYTQQQCESTPSISGILKCKWDTTAGACRDYACSEADVTLNTDAKCSSWLAGCVTKGQGCVNAPRPACATYTGDDAACQSFIGSDGNCELATGTTNCKAKECANAPTSLASDDDCKAYQRGCITTGKGCVLATTKPLCSTYSGDNTTCVGYIGSDGVCEGDAGGSKCRARKCENGAFNTDDLCKQYQSSCKTNGKACVSALSACNTYKGTATTCAVYIGTDGYCKGTSTTTEAACAPKVCDEAPDTTTTDDACAKYQVGCVTTGKGCVTKTNLKSCTTYDGDTTSCQSRVGTEGKCTWKSGTKCVARDCASAASNVNTNPLCANYFTNCVTTGSGCVSQTTCDATVKQQSCEGTNNCSWQPICTSNTQCSDYKKKSICLANQARIKTQDGVDDSGNPKYIYVTGKCGWLNNACKDLACSDLTGAFYNTDANCAAELSTCISNRVDACITKYDCAKLVGTQSTCLSYPGYCTNVASATDTTPCVSRKCADNTDATDNATCATFLPGCITSGKGCVDYNTPCTSMKGTQENCNKLFAYKSGSSTNFTTNQCYNSASATDSDFCKVKTCKLAENQTDGSCGSFLDGCVYNGNAGCVDPKAGDTTCASYTGVAAFCESAIVGNNSSKYCFGTSTSGACKQRECTDNTTATKDEDCEAFLTGCIAKSEGGCAAKSARQCSGQNGTVATCPNFSGGLSPSWTKVGCTKYDTCADRVCSDKATPSQASDCTDYKSTCRFLKAGSPCIDAAACTSYSTPDTATTDQQKFDYCTTIKDNSGYVCGWASGTKCASRTCDQFLSTFTTSLTCVTYLQKNVSSAAADTCKLAGTFCYLPKANCDYAFPTGIDTDAKKLTQCQKYVNTSGVFCSFKTADATCTKQDKCDKIVSQTSAQVCNDVLGYGVGICQKVTNTGCIETVAACTSYTLDSTLSDANKKAACDSLKPVNDVAKFGLGTATYTACTWSTGNTCAAYTCATIATATSQKDCDSKLAGCYYYSGKCYASVTACPTSFPAELDTDTKKAIYCKAMFKTGGTYCEIKPDGTACQDGSITDCVLTLSTAWTAASAKFDGATTTTDAFCVTQSAKDKSKYCIKDDNAKCKAGTCENIPSPTSQADCDIHLIGCVFSASKCRTPKVTALAAATDCADTAKLPFADATGLARSAKTAYCQVFSKDGASVFCTYDEFHATTQTACVGAGACDTYATLPVGDAARLTYCLSKVNASGKKCGFTAGATKCRDFDCQDIASPTSQVDCDLQANALKCVYYKGTCVNDDAACAAVPAIGTTADDKRTYCANLSVTEPCTYAVGAFCVKQDTCDKYDVTDATDKAAACGALSDGTNKCTFIQGTKCVTLDTCDKYDGALGPAAGSEEAQCKAVKSKTNYPCIKDTAQKCKAQACTDNDASAADCASNAPDCIYYSSKCIAKTTCGGYTAQGADDAAKQTWCEGVTNSSGDLCAWDAAGGKCKDRTCGDKSFYTDFDCSSYLKSCKTNGSACVASTTACSSSNGSTDFCNLLLDGTAKDKCKPLAPATPTAAGACTNKKCYDNVTATSDSECDSYLSGCVTRGTGCIPNSEPCTSYRGTKLQCELFKKFTGLDANKNPIYEYCSGDATNTATGKCKVRTCADNITASSDTDCAAYLKGCITKGTGCIDATSSCGGFKGDQATCAKFLGSSGKDYCWNTSTALATAVCAKKKCSDIAGKNNKDCNDGMPPFKTTDDPFCVYDGTGCIDYGKNCSTFNGTEETCPTYLAKDGPCKATTVGTIKGACAKRVCTEAPNTLATDADCQKYHKDCVTTGYGCTATKNCSNLTSQAACKLRAECTWANQCTASITTCATYNNTSYSQCTNSKVNGKFCAWTESNSTCRAQVCEDQPATIASHAQCQSFADNCTTSGAGCLTITTCPSYKTQSICIAASTTKDGVGRCGWDTATNKCRSRVCGDKNGLTDDECNTFLAGCKTNGSSCVAGASCTEFSNKQFCIKSNFGPCLWVNGQCYDYDRCEDAIKKTHTECQGFSPLCTTNGDTCIPITNCASTTLKASCVVGTDGACGWLPTGKCQKFGQCTDAVAATNDECLSYGPTCITDGTACIAKAACGTYKTQTACNNLGTDGICYWNATANTCKLKECGDEQKGSFDQCKLISVTGGSCTTDGTKCIPLAACSSYVEAGCFTGTDGECTFALPVGATTGTKTCRQKQCEDITGGTSNANCMGVIAGKNCVSNGTSCIAKAACSTYKTITSCNGGGLENNKSTVCAFTPTGTDKVNGTCKTFTACADATKDKLACTTNPTCKWTENSTGTTCANHACDTFATGTDCQPIPSFDGTSSTVCVLQSGKCAAADPGTMTDSKICYTKSAYTYSWNVATNKCESCISGSVNPNNSNGTNNNTDNGTTTTDSAYILSVISLGLLGLMA